MVTRARSICIRLAAVAAVSLPLGAANDAFSSSPRASEAHWSASPDKRRVVPLPLPRDKPSKDHSWRSGLTNGPNGPIPVIVVDQFGYLPNAPKVAVIRDPQEGFDHSVSFTPGNEYALVDVVSGETIKMAAPEVWNDGATDDVSGDRAWWFDFSDVSRPGTYFVKDLEQGQRSVTFEIREDVYGRVLDHAVRMFFYQRAGFAKSAETVGAAWADGASHLGEGQDPQSRSWLAKEDPAQEKDLRGGWYDAGDYNKYTNWTARNVIALLRAFEENPHAFSDATRIAESGNGTPDVLDEAVWGLDWLKRMQTAEGALLSVQGLAEASPPSAADGRSYYGPPTTSASLMGAAVFAYASKVFAQRPEAHLRAYAADLLLRAHRAWDWASENPDVLYFNNDEDKQPGSRGLAAGQQEKDDAGRLSAKFQAAVYLYETTGGARFREFADANHRTIIAEHGLDKWQAEEQEIVLYYSQLPSVAEEIREEIRRRFLNDVKSKTDQLPSVLKNNDPYRSPIRDYTWGSNQSKMHQARLYQLLARFTDNPKMAEVARSAALGFVNYIHGVNPLGLVYLTNMQQAGAEHSAATIYHNWFSYDSPRWSTVSERTPGPPPGFLVGGPNPQFNLDRCCTAPLGAEGHWCYGAAAFYKCSGDYSPPRGNPPAKSYLQFNTDWPTNSWEVTEPSTEYQVTLIRVLAGFAGKY